MARTKKPSQTTTPPRDRSPERSASVRMSGELQRPSTPPLPVAMPADHKQRHRAEMVIRDTLCQMTRQPMQADFQEMVQRMFNKPLPYKTFQSTRLYSPDMVSALVLPRFVRDEWNLVNSFFSTTLTRAVYQHNVHSERFVLLISNDFEVPSYVQWTIEEPEPADASDNE